MSPTAALPPLGAEPWFRSALRAAAATEALVVEPVADPDGRPLGLVVLRLDLRGGRGANSIGRILAYCPTMAKLLPPTRTPLEPAEPAEAWRELLAWAPGAPLVGRTLAREIGGVSAGLARSPSVAADLARRSHADLLETVEGMARHGNARLAALPVRGLWEVAAMAGIAKPAKPNPMETASATARVWALLAPALCEFSRQAAARPDAGPCGDPGRLSMRLGPNAAAAHACLAGADLHGRDLSGADLSGADLSSADLSGADLSGAHLAGADLSGANLTRANLTRANLSGANLAYADLSHADLALVCLDGARLTGATGAAPAKTAQAPVRPVRRAAAAVPGIG